MNKTTTASSTPYYNKKDIIGNFLRSRRNSVALQHIRGYLVDLACGDNTLGQSYPGKSSGIDFQDYGNVDLIVSDYSKLPLESNTVDTVSIIASLNYLSNPSDVLTESRRILKDDGQLLITMANPYVMKIWHTFREPWAHKPSLSDTEIRELAYQTGFHIGKTKAFLLGLNKLYILKKA